MSNDNDPNELEDFNARLRRAQESASQGESEDNELPSTSSQGFSLAIRIGSELVAALAVGVLIGYLLDRWLETTPWLMVVFFFLGSAAGILNVYRASEGIGMAPGYSEQNKAPGAKPMFKNKSDTTDAEDKDFEDEDFRQDDKS
ncbi:MAG: AtpZ/AtpI family protein [Rhodospirillales bacterium]|nr:AtpZ/AtpI family protein [Rhodospirillales bacterium]